MKRVIIFVFPGLLCIDRTEAQDIRNESEAYDFVFAHNHFSVSIMTGIAIKAIVEAPPNRYQLGSSHQLAFGGGINHHYNISKKLSLIMGIQLATVVRNLQYNIPRNAFTPDYGSDVIENGGPSTEAVFLFRLPVTIETRLFDGNKKYWQLQAGISLMYAALQEEEITHTIVYPAGQAVRIFNMRLQTNNNNRPWLNYHIGGGHGWLLKNSNLLSIGVLANLSFTKFIKGDYSLSVPGQPTLQGTYAMKGSYIGLTGNYIFTGARKRMRTIDRNINRF